MRILKLLLLFNLIPFGLFSQIVINSSDIPNVNDTFRVSVSSNISGFDPDLTGADYFWDCSFFNSIRQEVDTFMAISSTPLVYRLYFSALDPAHMATIATRDYNTINPIPNLQISEIYNFLKETTTSFKKVGFGAKINNVQTPVKYDNPILLYSFPLTMNQSDSSVSFYDMNIPSFGYFAETITRKNTVDGWGSIVTPYDTFDVVRVKSIIKTSDTIYYTQFSNGMRFPTRTEYEYLWLADYGGIPVMQINKTSLVTTARYKDDIENPLLIQNKKQSNEIFIYPCPTNGKLNISNLDNDCLIIISDLTGKTINKFSNTNSIDISCIPKGIYFINIFNVNLNSIYSDRIIKL